MSDEFSGEAGTGEGGSASGGDERAWLSSIPENLRSHEAFKEVKTLPEVYQRFADMTVKSRELVAIPGEKSTDEERTAFYQKLGRPESSEKYSISKPEGLPEDIPYSVEQEAAFKNVAHSLNLTDAQAKGLYEWYHKELVIPAFQSNKDGLEAIERAEKAELEKAVNALKDAWKGDEFKVNIDSASRAFNLIIEKAGIKDEALDFASGKKIDGLKVGDHPTFLKIFHYVSKAISDDSLHGGSQAGDRTLTPAEFAKEWFPNSPNMHK